MRCDAGGGGDAYGRRPGQLVYFIVVRLTRNETVMAAADHLRVPPANPRGRSSAGRAPALQAGSQGFESPRLHRKRPVVRK